MARKMLRNPNKYGTIVNLGKNRRRPFMVKVNPRLNSKGYYDYNILGYFEDRAEAMIALADYNKNPCDLNRRDLTFSDMFQAFYHDKYERSKKIYSESSKVNAKFAFKSASILHDRKFIEIRHSDLQGVIDDCPLSHASLEHIMNLFKQIYKFALRESFVEKNAAEFIRINIPDDDEHGIRFDEEDLLRLWNNTEKEQVKLILVYIYTGWRATELLELPKENIDIVNMTMTGGKKTAAGKNRIVPIHSKIKPFVVEMYNYYDHYVLSGRDVPVNPLTFRKLFNASLKASGITKKYTPHDCRHTFESKLDDAGVPQVIKDRLMGHASKSLGEKIYTHKTIEQLRNAVESIE